jgi:hypothetical protein
MPKAPLSPEAIKTGFLLIDMTYIEKLKSPKWQKKRLEILNRDKFTCQNCCDKDSQLQIHHLYYEKNSDPWEQENKSLLTLCEDCHKQFTETNNKFKKVIGKITDIDTLNEFCDLIDDCTPCNPYTPYMLKIYFKFLLEADSRAIFAMESFIKTFNEYKTIEF